MENRGYSIYEIGILGGNDKGEIKFILFLMFYDKKKITNRIYVLTNINFIWYILVKEWLVNLNNDITIHIRILNYFNQEVLNEKYWGI